MTTLRTAAQQALEALKFYKGCYGASPAEEATITALKAALVEDAMQKFTDVNQELEAALAEPEERNFCPRCGKRTQDVHTCTPP